MASDHSLVLVKKKNMPVVPSTGEIPPENLITIEELAKRLHQTESWVREKCRRRSPNPIPVYNLGRHLLFDWIQVSEWIRNSPRPIHSAHKRRWKKRPQERKAA
jgi:hypothetical protein